MKAKVINPKLKNYGLIGEVSDISPNWTWNGKSNLYATVVFQVYPYHGVRISLKNIQIFS